MRSVTRLIKRMQLTEKGTRLTELSNQYLFQVEPSANKIEIRRAVEELFGVSVVRVNTLNRPGKKKRERTMNFGRTSAWKRAIVTLKEGDSIDLT